MNDNKFIKISLLTSINTFILFIVLLFYSNGIFEYMSGLVLKVIIIFILSSICMYLFFRSKAYGALILSHAITIYLTIKILISIEIPNLLISSAQIILLIISIQYLIIYITLERNIKKQ